MPSTIAWLAVAVATGALAGLALGHWTSVSAWWGRVLQDPTVPPSRGLSPEHPTRKRTPRTP